MRSLFIVFAFVSLLLSCGEKQVEASETIAGPEPILMVYSPGVNPAYIKNLTAHIEKSFARTIKVKQAPVLPASLKSTMHAGRYRGDSILHYLQRTYAAVPGKVLYITHHDISVTKYAKGTRIIKKPASRYKDWAVFGYGACPGKTCVVSVYRLWTRKASEKTFLQRLKNISVHELGHTFGLPHCPQPQCVMNDANETIRTVDNSTGLFCESCKSKID